MAHTTPSRKGRRQYVIQIKRSTQQLKLYLKKIKKIKKLRIEAITANKIKDLIPPLSSPLLLPSPLSLPLFPYTNTKLFWR